MKHYISAALLFLGSTLILEAKENANIHRHGPPTGPPQVMAGCAPSKSRADLDVNNVRTPIWINGDMWWDLTGNALYEVPKGSGKHSLFAGAIWIGGKAPGGVLKVAAQTYRQSGSDFWPGPIDTSTTSITPEECLKYDKHYKVTFAEVKNFHEQYQIAGNVNYPIPDVIKNWPGNGDSLYHEDRILAPFFDRANDGFYDYNDGDYPKYVLDATVDPCDKSLLLGDQTIWWVFNDVGNIHGETGSLANVGVEIQARAFGFNTNDEINNMTFYRYRIINRATSVLNETYFGSWVDPDLGNYLDDYVGCDVGRGLGYCFNGDADDDGALGYGANPPAVGVDFFEGPIADDSDGVDNNRNGVLDEPGEQIIMSKFVYYNNDNSNTGNPNTAQQYYNYLDGVWKDGSQLLYGGTGYQTSPAIPCDFMFPGNTDPNNIGTHGTDPGFEWTENEPTAGGTPNEPSDRRFLQSAGKFTLQPGAVNYITTGVVWARTSSGGPNASVKLLKLADVKAQNLFEACFKVMDGPDAPDLSLRELDKEIIISLKNPDGSNNANEGYGEKDINIPGDPAARFVFEGYKVYQVKDPAVTVNDLLDADKARLVFQSDIQNGIAQIVNQVLDGDLNAFVPTEQVIGADKGLRHAFRITKDEFATGDPSLVNHKTYYFMAVAYGYDNVADVLDPFDPNLPPGIFGQPYIQSRKGADGNAVLVYTAIPHIPTPEANGLVLNTEFGDGPEIQRWTGMGNGYVIGSDRGTLDLKQDQIDQILFSQSNPTNRLLHPVYERGRGPVDIRIYDPVKVPAGDFELYLTDTVTSTGGWILHDVVNNVDTPSEKSLEFPYDQLFPSYGFSISISQVKAPGEYVAGGNGLVGGTIEYDDPNARWYGGIPDIDNVAQQNWILAGNSTDPTLYEPPDILNASNIAVDGPGFFEKIIGGTWGPYSLTSKGNGLTTDYIEPAPDIPGLGSAPQDLDSLRFLSSIDVVLTPDRTKWSRCVVFEMGKSGTENNQLKNLIRKHKSLDVNYNESSVDSGYSYFPGYAINVETGERLNIAFGEDSHLASENGNDMKWNPTSNLYAADGTLLAGGKHYIYVFGHKNPETLYRTNDSVYYGPAYDGCKHIHDRLWGILPSQLSNGSVKNAIKETWKDCMWVSCPRLSPGQVLLSNRVKIRIRMAKPYRQYDTQVSNSINNNFPYYKFSTTELVARVNQSDVAKSALDLINVVPNPYYAYSNYESNQLDNRIKIVNLPPKCVISIYTPSGTLVRRLNRDAGSNVDYNNTGGAAYPNVNLESSVDWDLKNTQSIPVASGMYLIHVEAPGVGEKTLKWFGVMRPIDLDTF